MIINGKEKVYIKSLPMPRHSIASIQLCNKTPFYYAKRPLISELCFLHLIAGFLIPKYDNNMLSHFLIGCYSTS